MSASDNKTAARGVGAHRYIGQRTPRKEDPRLLSGRGQFVDDISLPGMLHCAFARSSIARGKILAIDVSEAASLAGVHAVYTAEDLASIDLTMLSFFLNPLEVETLPLAKGQVAYVNEPVALVIADNRYIAEDGAALIEVEYDEQTPVITLDDARRAGPIHAEMDDNIAAEMGDEDIDDALQAAMDQAAFTIEHKVVHQRIAQSPMETRGIIASRDGADELTIWAACQGPHLNARWWATALGFPEAAIRVIAKDVGGSFGLKNHPWKEEVATVLAALKFGRPLKWIEDRYENLTAANQAREQEMTLKIAFEKDGKMLGAYGDYSSNNGAFPQGADANIAVHMFIWGAYNMPAYGFISRGYYSNTPGLAAYRGPWAMESLVRETALDKAARHMGIDPFEIRAKNLVTSAQQPDVTSMGIPRADVSTSRCMDKLIHTFDYPGFRKKQAEARTQGRYLGLGFAAYIEPSGAAGSMPIMTAEPAHIRIDPTGKVIASMSTHSQGHGTATTMAQLIADTLGVSYEDVQVFEGDSTRGGFSPAAGGSRQAVLGGGAAIETSRMLADKVKTIAAHLLNTSKESIRIEDGQIHADGAPEMSRPLRDIAAIAYGEPDRLPAGMETGLEVQHRYLPPPMQLTSAAHLCVVEVDTDTGFVSIKRWIAAEDCGTLINPAVVEGQIAGGLAQAIGMVLLEDAHYDANGNPLAVTYKDYLLPAISNVPQFEYLHIGDNPSSAVGGMRGIGEGGAIIGPPALANAIADALAPFGELEMHLPLTPPKLLSLIEGRDIASHFKTDDNTPVMAAARTPAAPKPIPVAVTPDASPTSIDGIWDMVLSTPMGPQEMKAHFSTDGSALSGKLSSAEGEQEFTGHFEDSKIMFDVKVTKPMKITLKYNLDVTGDALSGTCKMGMFGKAKVKGNKIS